ncbi:MAG: ArdC family protein [Hyphomicrobiaceae bacterium]
MATNTPRSRQSIYETITNTILAAIESGPGDPVMPWQRGGSAPVLPVNAVTANPYRGINILSLWVAALDRGYASGEWATLNQWNAKGATVTKGETASPIVFYREIDKTNPTTARGPGTASDDDDANRAFIARGYWVFAAEQVTGYQPAHALPPNPIERIAAAEAYFAATGARIIPGGAQAYYRPSTDTIHMPDEARFFETGGRTRTQAWYSVLGHETAHWAGAPHRLNRNFGKRFGDDAYCFEEACAECCAAFLCARLRIAAEPHPDHARYIGHWLTVMKANPRALFAAAAKAQEAVAYLDNLQAPQAQCAA